MLNIVNGKVAEDFCLLVAKTWFENNLISEDEYEAMKIFIYKLKRRG